MYSFFFYLPKLMSFLHFILIYFYYCLLFTYTECLCFIVRVHEFRIWSKYSMIDIKL